MKVTVQNGATTGLSRRDLEAVIPLFPPSWSSAVQQVVLYQGETSLLKLVLYPKEKLLGLFWPVPAKSASKAEGLQELMLALSVIAERGELPERLSPATRERHLVEVDALLQRCPAKVLWNAV